MIEPTYYEETGHDVGPNDRSRVSADSPVELEESHVADVRTLGTLGLMLAGAGLLLLPWSLVPFGMSSIGTAGRDELWVTFFTSASLALSVLLLCASVGCLSVERWGRSAMIGYAVGMLLLGVAGLYFFLPWLRFYPVQGRAQLAAGGQGAIARGYDLTVFVPICAWFFGSAFAALALWVMTRRGVRDIFLHALPRTP